MTRGYFSIIRFVPDTARQEQINIGAITVFPTQSIIEFDVRVSTKRAKCLSESFDNDEVDSLRFFLQRTKDSGQFSLVDRESGERKCVPVASLDFLSEIISRRSLSTVQCGEIGVVEFSASTINEEQARKFLDDLIQRYVIYASPIKEKAERKSRLKTQIKHDLSKRDLIGDSLEGGKVMQDAPLANFRWKYDFAIKNGSTKVFETLDLSKISPNNIQALFNAAGIKYMKLSEATIYFGDAHDPLKTYIVYSAGPDKIGELQDELDRLNHITDELINYATPEGKQRFMEIIDESIRGHTQAQVI